jgi:predicted RNase H-like HicB family nuclease
MTDDKRSSTIKNIGKYVYWKFEGLWVGHFEKYPEYLSKGETISELREGLLKIHDLIKQGKLKTP